MNRCGSDFAIQGTLSDGFLLNGNIPDGTEVIKKISQDATSLTVKLTGCSNDSNGQAKCSCVMEVSNVKKEMINGRVLTEVAQKPITKKDSSSSEEEGKTVLFMWDLLKGLDNTTVIAPSLSDYKFKTLTYVDNPSAGGLCLLYGISDVTVDAQVYTDKKLQLGMGKFNPQSKQLLYIVAEPAGYYPYYYNPITVEAGVSGIFVTFIGRVLIIVYLFNYFSYLYSISLLYCGFIFFISLFSFILFHFHRHYDLIIIVLMNKYKNINILFDSIIGDLNINTTLMNKLYRIKKKNEIQNK
ncbi:hypothetical protein EDI_214540 [Entamoeba dispar SAW760]|uniref:Uncharacterized protein n=1 Tax=Entamoeba dispar (strain ATCC PRA-260 / SAW760) TaxID=370354 RepID=B0EU00_ENTDS|nr:uncharacterized protein EDI_214540 [Entamoeba dispar SAW760]EDR22001.1 hypothetical protein EDI_214540 [Entamoeba dispar SAW760]|eukprot:EDR22001.1 hypothetical protein EDI_214540 [Entamoeba dispar SAW760]